MISKNTKSRTTCTSRLGHRCPKRDKTTWVRLASLLTARLASVPTIRLAHVLVPICTGATQIVKVKSQKKERGERGVVGYRKRVVPLLFMTLTLTKTARTEVATD
jgi:hypothetical protein